MIKTVPITNERGEAGDHRKCPLMTRESCTKCNRLWSAYQEAVRAHIKLLVKYQEVVIRQDSASLIKLDRLLRSAEKRRRDARGEVQCHESTHGQPLIFQ